MKLLVVEDDRDTALTLKDSLKNDFVVELAFTGDEGEYLCDVNSYDLIILDIILPDTNGIILCRNIRKKNIATPILMLTGQSSIEEKVRALDSGADDYLTKPFSVDELIARIKAILRRPREINTLNLITIGDLTIELNTKTVKRGSILLNLRRKEFYLLEYLARNVGRVITREMILSHVWESSEDPLTNIVDVHIKYLRDLVDKKFDKKLIKTVHGLGYKLEA